MLCINLNKWDIWTKTGSVGCFFQLFYKDYDNSYKLLPNNIFSNNGFITSNYF